MKLSNKSIKPLVHGVYQTKEEDGYLTFYHYDDAQIEYLRFNEFFYDRARASSSVTLEFETDAKEIGFDYKIFWVGSKDTVDVYADNVPVCITHLKALADKGKMAFSLPEGKKKLTVYFPIDVKIGIKNLRIEGKWRNIKKKGPKVLWMGDSITQGYGTFITSETYVNVAMRKLGYDVLNQGIGGYYFDANVITPMEGYTPDKIIIAMGTNQHTWSDNERRVAEYFEKLDKVYNGIPTLVLTPIWRCNPGTDMKKLLEIAEIIKVECAKYPNIKVVDGFELVPNLPDYFCDALHPNALGGEVYGNNLVNKIKELKF
ncbi:MAG: SGNH/GDSL hydrolase family protein [Ruminococcaceae bacterium]|nr:SGNH/GDSL hydrolase family protein [Oscillospiraceae bacterium]